MTQDTTTAFLIDKIQQLENALFTSESKTLVNLPTHIVRISETDDQGNIWFIIPKPTQVVESFPEEMPAKLDFFKKGVAFYVKILGIASIVWTGDDLPLNAVSKNFSDTLQKGNVVAVKVKIESYEYSVTSAKPSSNPLMNVGSHVYNWLLNPLFSS